MTFERTLLQLNLKDAEGLHFVLNVLIVQNVIISTVEAQIEDNKASARVTVRGISVDQASILQRRLISSPRVTAVAVGHFGNPQEEKTDVS